MGGGGLSHVHHDEDLATADKVIIKDIKHELFGWGRGYHGQLGLKELKVVQWYPKKIKLKKDPRLKQEEKEQLKPKLEELVRKGIVTKNDLEANQQANKLAKAAATHHMPPGSKVQWCEARTQLTQAYQDCMVVVWQAHITNTQPHQAIATKPSVQCGDNKPPVTLTQHTIITVRRRT